MSLLTIKLGWMLSSSVFFQNISITLKILYLPLPLCPKLADWLSNHFYFSSMDKPSQMVVVICKLAIRQKSLQSFPHLNSLNAKMIGNSSLSQTFLTECSSKFPFIPDSFRWLTNAHNFLFSPSTKFITSGVQATLEIVKVYTHNLHSKLINFSRVETNALCLINSQYDFPINFPPKLFLATPLMLPVVL